MTIIIIWRQNVQSKCNKLKPTIWRCIWSQSVHSTNKSQKIFTLKAKTPQILRSPKVSNGFHPFVKVHVVKEKIIPFKTGRSFCTVEPWSCWWRSFCWSRANVWGSLTSLSMLTGLGSFCPISYRSGNPSLLYSYTHFDHYNTILIQSTPPYDHNHVKYCCTSTTSFTTFHWTTTESSVLCMARFIHTGNPDSASRQRFFFIKTF